MHQPPTTPMSPGSVLSLNSKEAAKVGVKTDKYGKVITDRNGDPEFRSWGQRFCDPLNACHGETWSLTKTKQVPWRQKSWKHKFFSVLHWFPVLNFFYFSFFQPSHHTGVLMVTIDSVQEVGLLIGTVAALVYTVMTAMPTSVSWDEFDVVDNHWSGPTEIAWKNFVDEYEVCKPDESKGETYDGKRHDKCWEHVRGGDTESTRVSIKNVTWPEDNLIDADTVIIGKYGCQIDNNQKIPWRKMSVRLGNQMSAASNFLLISINLSIVFVISAVTLTRVKKEKNGFELEVPEDSIEAWFQYGKYVILGCFFTALWGFKLGLDVLGDIYYLKFPHPWLRKVCEAHGWVPLYTNKTDDASIPFAFSNTPATGYDGVSEWSAKTEILADQYVAGPNGAQFVEYTSVSSMSRWWHGKITLGGVTTDITDMDPMQTNGFGFYTMTLASMVGLAICGYGQACADTKTKEKFAALAMEEVEKEQELERIRSNSSLVSPAAPPPAADRAWAPQENSPERPLHTAFGEDPSYSELYKTLQGIATANPSASKGSMKRQGSDAGYGFDANAPGAI